MSRITLKVTLTSQYDCMNDLAEYIYSGAIDSTIPVLFSCALYYE